jgi:DNA-directed RNA polymerase specialized sigma subunit
LARSIENTPDHDWLLASIELVESAAEAARRALDAAVQSVEETRRERQAGLPMVEIADRALARSGREARLQASAAMDEYENAVMRFRGGVVRALVDEGNLSLSEVARRMGVSRQVVARLYRAGTDTAE